MRLLARFSCAAAFAFLLTMVFSPLAARADYFTGKWSFSGALGNPPVEQMAGVCAIAVNSHGAVAGSCRGPYGVAKAEGVTNGVNIVLRIHHLATRPGGISGIATLRGVWYRGGIIRGWFTDSPLPGARGSFIGRPVR